MNNPEFAQVLRELQSAEAGARQAMWDTRGIRRVSAHLALHNARDFGRHTEMKADTVFHMVQPPRVVIDRARGLRPGFLENDLAHMTGSHTVDYYGWHQGDGLTTASEDRALNALRMLQSQRNATDENKE